MGQHQRAGITQVRADCPVDLLQLDLAGKARGQDLGAHAAHQVS